METSPPGEYRNQQIENLEEVIAYLFSHKGAQEIWEEVKHTFVPIHGLFEGAISKAHHTKREPSLSPSASTLQ